jgi:maltose O-acetyltransferase
MSLLLSLSESRLLNSNQRLSLLRHLGLHAGEGSYIEASVRFRRPNLSKVTLGYRCYINEQCYLENSGFITLGDDVCLAPGVMILTTTHNVGDSTRRSGRDCIRKPVVIGSGCWIGARSIILPGVWIAPGSVIAAGSVASRNCCCSDSLYAGVPAEWKKYYEKV